MSDPEGGKGLAMPDAYSGLDFARAILPRVRSPRRGDPLPSTMFGALSIVLGIVNLAALLGRGPQAIPGLVTRATILLAEESSCSTRSGASIAPAWWFVPESGFWVVAGLALALAALGLLLSRGRGRPIAGGIGFGLNATIAVGGYLLAFTDFRFWG